MAKMSTIPVFACRRCTRPVYATHVMSLVNDPDGKLLNKLMAGLSEIALCEECRKRYNYYASRNRLSEFYAEQFNPHAVLYNVRPGVSEVDWYGRNSD